MSLFQNLTVSNHIAQSHFHDFRSQAGGFSNVSWAQRLSVILKRCKNFAPSFLSSDILDRAEHFPAAGLLVKFDSVLASSMSRPRR